MKHYTLSKGTFWDPHSSFSFSSSILSHGESWNFGLLDGVKVKPNCSCLPMAFSDCLELIWWSCLSFGQMEVQMSSTTGGLRDLQELCVYFDLSWNRGLCEKPCGSRYGLLLFSSAALYLILFVFIITKISMCALHFCLKAGCSCYEY